jgi:hypothetical protein
MSKKSKKSEKKADEKLEMVNILNNLLEVFPFPELQGLVRKMKDPLHCKDTAEVLEALQDNIEMLKEKEQVFKGHTNADTSQVQSYVSNPSNFSKAQWEAIQKTKEDFHKYERNVDIALESGEIRQVAIDERKENKKKRKKKSKRFKKRKNWIEM